MFRASGFARPIPGVRPERNLNGISFAVANVTGFVARACETTSDRTVNGIVAAANGIRNVLKAAGQDPDRIEGDTIVAEQMQECAA